MKKLFLKRIFKATLHSIPLVQSIQNELNKSKNLPALNDNTSEQLPKESPDWVKIGLEAIIVSMVVAFISGKLTYEQLHALISLIIGQ